MMDIARGSDTVGVNFTALGIEINTYCSFHITLRLYLSIKWVDVHLSLELWIGIFF